MRRKNANREYSLRRHIVLIILGTMGVLLCMQIITLSYFLQRNDQRRQEYVNGIVNALNTSLTAMGNTIEGLGSYISSYRAFQDLYINRTGSTDSYVDAYQTTRFIATHMPVISNIIVVDLNKIPASYYSAQDFNVVDLVDKSYSLTDPTYTEKAFFFWTGREYFAYVVPIQGIYTTADLKEKQATAILVCNMEYVKSFLNTEQEIALAFYDAGGQVIASHGQISDANDTNTVLAQAVSMPVGLTIRASGSTSYGQDVYLLLSWFFIFSVIVIVICMLFVLSLLNRSVANPIINLANSIALSDFKNLKRRVPNIAIIEINKIVNSFNQILDENAAVTKQIFTTQDKLYESELRKTQAELGALQSQINPHFLYNTLQCIRSLAILDRSAEIADITLAMSEVFRYSIQPAETVLFSDELLIIKKYQIITDIRFQYRFKFIYEIDEKLYACKIIKMLVQPIIENAVLHGVTKREDGGTIWIKGWLEAQTVYLSVSDDGPDLDMQDIETLNDQINREYREKETVKSLGLYNINRRLILRYGRPYGLRILRENDLTTVTISFPYIAD